MQATHGSFVPPPRAGRSPAAASVVDELSAAFDAPRKSADVPTDDASRRLTELLPATGAILGGFALVDGAGALMAKGAVELTPDSFRPVCPASDGFYNFGKGLGDSLLGAEGAEYRPLVIEALLRLRLEVCVLESFVYEAIIPFIERKGVGWILPFRETIDTVIAGTVFAVAINFILFGTTKILAVLSIYHDFLIGAPLRLIGYAVFPEPRQPEPAPFIQINWPGQEASVPEAQQPQEEEEEREPPVLPLAVFGGICKGYGIFAEVVKNVLEGLDTFVGRYLAFTSVAYVGFKWAHFRLFNDFFGI